MVNLGGLFDAKCMVVIYTESQGWNFDGAARCSTEGFVGSLCFFQVSAVLPRSERCSAHGGKDFTHDRRTGR